MNIIKSIIRFFLDEPIFKKTYFWFITILTVLITLGCIGYVVFNLNTLLTKVFGTSNLSLPSILFVFILSVYKQYTSFFPLYQVVSKNDGPSKTSDALLKFFIDLCSAYVLMTADVLAIIKQIKFINYLETFSAVISICVLGFCYWGLLFIYDKLFKSEDEFYDFRYGQNKELNQCLLQFININKSTTNEPKRELLCNIPVSENCEDFFMPNDIYNAFYKLNKAGFIKKGSEQLLKSNYIEFISLSKKGEKLLNSYKQSG